MIQICRNTEIISKSKGTPNAFLLHTYISLRVYLNRQQVEQTYDYFQNPINSFYQYS